MIASLRSKICRSGLTVLVLLFGPWLTGARAQQIAEPVYEEIFVYLKVQYIGGIEMGALYNTQDESLLLPVQELFSYLRIHHSESQNFDTITGFLIDENMRYEINHTSRTILFNNKTFPVPPREMVKTEQDLYLHARFFGEVFGLTSIFSFRTMSVELKTNLELPAIREMRLQQLRQNLEILKGDQKADTAIGRAYHLFRPGMLDWSIISTQISGHTSDYRLSAGTGIELLAGETNLIFNYSTKEGFDWRNQQYSWRWVSDKPGLVQQVRAGKIGAGSLASIWDPVHGVSVTNASTQFRRSFGSYTLADHTEPGWTIELYVNNVLVAYQIADASGYYSFDVPLVYGSSEVLLKFYGPHGEERTKQQYLSIPYQFLPKGETEYTLTAGLVSDTLHSRFGRAVVNTGISRYLTMSAGVEYLSSVSSGPVIPFATASVTPLKNLLINGEYSYGVRYKGLLQYRLKNQSLIETEYTRYQKEQLAVRYNYLEERKVTLQLPVHIGSFRAATRLSYKQNIYTFLHYNTADITFTTLLGNVSTNFSAFSTWVDNRNPYIVSSLTLGFRFKKALIFRPQVQYDLTNHELITLKAELEKKIGRSGYLSLIYQDNPSSGYRSVEASFRWDLPFAQTFLSARASNFDLTTTQGGRGGIALNNKEKSALWSNRSALGKCGVVVYPFLDINHNFQQDPDEPLVQHLNIRLNGGRITNNINDSTISIFELEPYGNYFLEADESGLENISWQLPWKRILITTDPLQFKHVPIPIQPAGEVNGDVILHANNQSKGLGRILVNIYKTDSTLAKQLITESDGYFSFMGLSPGDYFLTPDSIQRTRLRMTATPEFIGFRIAPTTLGDIVSGLQLVLQRDVLPSDTAAKQSPVSDSALVLQGRLDTLFIPGITPALHPDTATRFTPGNGLYFIQTGAFNDLAKAENAAKALFIKTQYKPGIVLEAPYYKVRTGYFATREQAESFLIIAKEKGFKAFLGTRESGQYCLRSGTFANRADAFRFVVKFKGPTSVTFAVVEDDGAYRILTSFSETAQGAEGIRAQLGMLGETFTIYKIPQ